MKKKVISLPKLTLNKLFEIACGSRQYKTKAPQNKMTYSPVNLFLHFIKGYFFVAFIFYSFYKKVELKFFIGYDFFEEGANIFHMFRDVG